MVTRYPNDTDSLEIYSKYSRVPKQRPKQRAVPVGLAELTQAFLREGGAILIQELHVGFFKADFIVPDGPITLWVQACVDHHLNYKSASSHTKVMVPAHLNYHVLLYFTIFP